MQVNGKVSKITNSRGVPGAFATSGGTMRALLLARKSNKVQINAAERGDGLSLETQDETARAYALAQDWTIVGAAGETMSGRKVKPTERKNLGPWLTEPALVCQWDVLVAARATGSRALSSPTGQSWRLGRRPRENSRRGRARGRLLPAAQGDA